MSIVNRSASLIKVRRSAIKTAESSSLVGIGSNQKVYFTVYFDLSVDRWAGGSLEIER